MYHCMICHGNYQGWHSCGGTPTPCSERCRNMLPYAVTTTTDAPASKAEEAARTLEDYDMLEEAATLRARAAPQINLKATP